MWHIFAVKHAKQHADWELHYCIIHCKDELALCLCCIQLSNKVHTVGNQQRRGIPNALAVGHGTTVLRQHSITMSQSCRVTPKVDCVLKQVSFQTQNMTVPDKNKQRAGSTAINPYQGSTKRVKTIPKLRQQNSVVHQVT